MKAKKSGSAKVRGKFEIKSDIRKQHYLYVNNLVGDVKANPKDLLIPKTRRCRNQHSFAFQIPSASKDAYKNSYFPGTIRD